MATIEQPGSQRLEVRLGPLPCAGEAGPLGLRMQKLPGVVDAVVNPITEAGIVVFDPSVISAAEIIDYLERREGYPVGRHLARLEVQVGGLLRDGAGSLVESAVRSLPGVRLATFDRRTDSLAVVFVPGKTDLESVNAALLANIAAG